MNCAHCDTENPESAARCNRCGRIFSSADDGADLPATVKAAAVSAPQGSWRSASGNLLALEPGAEFGPRYRIESRLGQGGMGAVYKAHDKELDRTVALKLVRPNLMADPETMQRFKQELLLAREISHKNILRIHDLGDVEGIKFISMAYIEGENLHQLLKKEGRLPVDRSIAIARQLCEALEAAHAAGVMHRDLKPQNVLIDREGTAYISDFGLAKSLKAGADGITHVGQFLGTPGYMSPEQVEGGPVDHRGDLYALGVILYEMVTGEVPFIGESTLKVLHLKESAKNPKLVNADLPDYLAHIIVRCLERDLSRRYQSAREVLNDLEGQHASRAPTIVSRRLPGGRWAIAVAALLFLSLGGYLSVDRVFFLPPAKQSASVKPVALAILPFRNASGNAALDWLGPSLTEMLRTDIGQSPYLRAVSPERLHQIFKDLRLSANTDFDSATLGRLAEFTGADKVLRGQYVKAGEHIRIDATIQDPKGQRSISLKAEAPNEKELIAAIGVLARSIQQNLALSADAVGELQTKPLQPSTRSLAALREYNEGLELSRLGNHSEALKHFEASTREDPGFAMAFSKLGQTHSTLGHAREAEQASQEAVRLSENLPEQERFLIIANHARIVNDLDKAIESYENLARALPADPQIHFDLGGLYESKGLFDTALDHFGKALQEDPKYVDALLAVGRVEIKRRNPQASLEPLNRALSLAIELGNQEAKANILNAIGVAYKRLHKPEDALDYYRKSLTIKREHGDTRGVAASLSEIAQVEARLGHNQEALASFQEALKLRRKIDDKKGVGNTLIDLGSFYQNRGQYDEALKLYKDSLQLQVEVGNQNYEALCLSNIGNIYLSKGQYQDARAYFERGLQLSEKSKVPADIATAVYDLADIATKMGQYDQALEGYMRSLELWRNAEDKRGVAIASYGMGTLFEYQGRYRAALDAKEEALKIFQEIEDRSFWLAEILSGRGNTLALVGRFDEAKKDLEAALDLAQKQQNNPLIAQILNFQGDRFYYEGDYTSARRLYDQALHRASRSSAPHVALVSKINLAKVAIRDGNARAALKNLNAAAKDAHTLGLKYVFIECAIHRGEALTQLKDYAGARQDLETAVQIGEKLGARALLVLAHHMLAKVFSSTRNPAEASRHSTEAFRLLEEIRKELHSDALLQREDLKPIAKPVLLSAKPHA
jgi:eukaryotic-like serine/threonine-protein kinase